MQSACSLHANPPPGICICSLCSRGTYRDDYGEEHPGSPQSSKTIKRHTLNDKMQQKRKEIQATILENTVLMATAGGDPTPLSGTSMADKVRCYVTRLSIPFHSYYWRTWEEASTRWPRLRSVMTT